MKYPPDGRRAFEDVNSRLLRSLFIARNEVAVFSGPYQENILRKWDVNCPKWDSGIFLKVDYLTFPSKTFPLVALLSKHHVNHMFVPVYINNLFRDVDFGLWPFCIIISFLLLYNLLSHVISRLRMN